ncbi:IS1 family transposase [Leptolyngbya sp. FACHB-16]|uniref:IS1 family transposase n=1 Tax=unclassified Leptolyngbya TaxID=2650499 RepID=UPI00321FF427
MPVNEAVLDRLAQHENLEVVVQQAGEAEMDEMWSFVGNKKQERWLWHAINHQTGEILAYVLAPHVDVALKELMALLAPFGIYRFYTGGWGAYARILDEDSHEVGKHHTQKIERKHLNLRTRIKRLARKTICFSKSERLHDTVIGLFINRYEFGRAI